MYVSLWCVWYLTGAVTFFVFISTRPVHVAELHVDQCHVHILARRTHCVDGGYHVCALEAALSPDPTVVGIF